MENISRIFLSISLFILLSFTKTFAEADLFLTPLLLYFNMLNNMTAKGGIPMKQKKYGLPTAITMIVGIVIGSGIFFKSDNILVYTGGNVAIGILVFSLAAISIIFGGVAVGELAARTDEPGGLVTYAQQFCSDRAACGFGWFQLFLYCPSLVCVVSWVGALYTFMLFGVESTLLQQVLLGCGYILLFFSLNIISAKLGGYFQNLATIIKLLPLMLIAGVGLLFGDPLPMMGESLSTAASVSPGWIAAVGPIAFAFDGWIISTSVAHEIKDSKRNLPLALIISPLFILLAYILYFVGISALVGPEQVMAMGDAHVDYAANLLFGPSGAKILLVFIVVSVLGTVNGLVLGLIRMPHALAIRGMLPASHLFSSIHSKLGVSLPSALFSFALSLCWMVIHYFTQRYGLLPNSDISEISITILYGGYLVLYWKVIQLARQGEIQSPLRGYVVPLLASVGSLFILWGGMQNPLFPLYALTCAGVLFLSQWYYRRAFSSPKES